jgi:hypothetical protein|tara:strand:- start:849 stop:989 length:141 start_codon:yes stop_codon:yes gene_type:complete
MKKYEIDFDKILSIEDMQLIINLLGIHLDETYKQFASIKHLLKERI